MDINDKVNTYLYFGYLPPENFAKSILNIWEIEERKFEYSIAGAIAKFDSLFDKLSSTCYHNKIIVPISGGWDSRAILGALLERFETKNIETVSFGVPGQLDYDIGRVVSKSCKVKHNALDLRSIKLTWSAIVESAKVAPWTYMPDAYFNSICRKKATNSQSSIWIGFLGDPLAGSHIPDTDQHDLADYFVTKQKKVPSVFLPERGFIPSISDQIVKYSGHKFLSDVLDICIRQSECIAPIVLPVEKWVNWDAFVGFETNGAQVIAPFADRDWAQYWLFAPAKLRKNQKLYLEMLNEKYNKLFSLPSKSTFGVLPNKKALIKISKLNHAIRRRIQTKFPQFRIQSVVKENYMNFDEAFRNRTDYQETASEAFDYLKKHEFIPWFNIDEVWNDHITRKKNYGHALFVLIGLAANLAAEENINP